MEQIEDHWRQESRDLLEMVSRLQEENRRLSASLQENQKGGGSKNQGNLYTWKKVVCNFNYISPLIQTSNFYSNERS